MKEYEIRCPHCNENYTWIVHWEEDHLSIKNQYVRSDPEGNLYYEGPQTCWNCGGEFIAALKKPTGETNEPLVQIKEIGKAPDEKTKEEYENFREFRRKHSEKTNS